MVSVVATPPEISRLGLGRVVAYDLGIAALDAAFAHAVLERQRNTARKGAES